MHHGVRQRKLGRTKDQRRALLFSLASSLVKYGAIETTEAKAKELSRVIEPMITRAREGGVSARRFLARNLPASTVKKLVDEVAPRYARRPGGYTRITKLPPRKSDNAPMAKIELV